jgi:hypothetical protein
MKNTVSLYVRERGSRKFDLAKPKFGVPGGFPQGTIFALRYKRPDGTRTFETLGDSLTYNEAQVAVLRRRPTCYKARLPRLSPEPSQPQSPRRGRES